MLRPKGLHHMQQFSNQEIAEIKSRIDQLHKMLGSGGTDSPVVMDELGQARDAQALRVGSSRPVLANQVAFNIQMRRMRKSHFGGARLTGPMWDMMLDLMLARAHGRELSASDLATGADVPLSSGLRMIAALETHDLARRSIDERDRRRSIVRLTETGAERMATYFEIIGAAWREGQSRAA